MTSGRVKRRGGWCCLGLMASLLIGGPLVRAQEVPCCFGENCVSMSSSDACIAEGGTPYPGYSCNDVPSPCAPTAEVACCLGQECLNLPADVCLAEGGTPMPAGVSCEDKPCEPRSCCVNGVCVDNVLPSDCIAHGGKVLPAGVKCEGDTCPSPECRPAPDGKSCRQTSCPGSNQRCRPRCVNFDPKSNEYRILACDCVNGERCHMELPAPGTTGGPQCVGGCPPGFKCVTRTSTLPDGTINLCCDCEPDPPACRPNAAKTGCEGECPGGQGQCIPSKIHQNRDGTIVVEACECRNPEACRPTPNMTCNGLCPPGSGPCREVFTQTAAGVDLECRCVCDPAACDDGNACTRDYCDPLTGQCRHDPISCDDQNACTEDACISTPNGPQCVHALKICDDQNRCTDDRCDPLTGECIFTPKNCDDGNPCTIDRCNPDTGGCMHAPDPACEQACCLGTQCLMLPADVCLSQGGTPFPGATCDDKPCETRSCCINGTCADNVLPQDCLDHGGQVLPPGVVCGPNETCPSPECRPTDDGKSCTQSTCPLSAHQRCRARCVAMRPDNPADYRILDCDCVGEDRCFVRLPQPGTTGAPQCDGTCPPGYKCETRITTTPDGFIVMCCDCVPEPPQCRVNITRTGCEGTCPDGTNPDGTKGECVPIRYRIGPNNRWEVEECSCRSPEVCHPVVTAAGGVECEGSCPDGSGQCVPVTVQDAAGVHVVCRCHPCDPALCDDGNACTKDYCDPLTGACRHDPISCDDQNACTEDACVPTPNGPMCIHALKLCDDGDPCTRDRCNPQTGDCVFFPVVCPDDGDPCTIEMCDPATGACVSRPNPECQACCLPDGQPCQNLPPEECKQKGGEPKGPGTNCDNVTCEPQTPKFRQPVSPEREDIASNINFNAPTLVNKIVTDDFRSDGRPITSVKWWGSYLDPAYRPDPPAGTTPKKMDGWLITFHLPLAPKPPVARPALGIYFAPLEAVRIGQINLVACDQHPVYQYEVDLSKCCLVDSNPDPRVPAADPWHCPAQPDAFRERYCYRYSLGIQAVVGVRWSHAATANCCVRQPNNNFAEKDFWGWHTTAVESDQRPALESMVSLGPISLDQCPLGECPPRETEFRFGPWLPAKEVCPFAHRINMAFELMTSIALVPPPCSRLVLVSATSIKMHGGAGEFGIDLPLTAVADAGVEPRRDGPTRIELKFSEPIMAGDGSLDPGDEVTVNVGTITGLSISGDVLRVELKDVPNLSCLLLTVENGPDGITTLGSDVLDGDHDVRVRVLFGDVNGNGSTNVADIGLVKSRSGLPVDASSFKMDLNANGVTNVADVGLVKAASGTSVRCP